MRFAPILVSAMLAALAANAFAIDPAPPSDTKPWALTTPPTLQPVPPPSDTKPWAPATGPTLQPPANQAVPAPSPKEEAAKKKAPILFNYGRAAHAGKRHP
jgi:hypothetical protein